MKIYKETIIYLAYQVNEGSYIWESKGIKGTPLEEHVWGIECNSMGICFWVGEEECLEGFYNMKLLSVE